MGTKQEMERLLADAQKLTGVKYDINNLSDVYEAIHAVQQELGITGTTAKEATETLTGSFSSMKAAFTDLMGNIAIGENIGESLRNLGETISTFILDNLIPMLWNIVKAIPQLVVGIFTEFIPGLIEGGKNAVARFKQGIEEGFPELREKLGNLWENTKTFFTETLPEMNERGREIFSNLVNGFMEKVPEWMSKLEDFIKKTMNYLLDKWPEWIKKGGEFVINLVTGLVNKIPDFLTKLGEFLGNAIKCIGEKLPEVIKKGGEMVVGLIKGIFEYLPKLLLTIGGLVVKLLGKLLEALPQLYEAGAKFIWSLLKGIVSAIPGILKAVGELALSILKAIGSVFTGSFQIGKDLISGLWKGISSAAGWIVDKVKGIGKSIIGGFKSVLGIHSPSAVFADFGKNINLGLAQGIENNLKPISNAMDKMQAETTRDFDNNVLHTVSSNFGFNNSKPLELTTKASAQKKEPIELTLNLGNKNFKAFVEDISTVQNEKIELELAY